MFEHSFEFDPSYGHDLQALMQVPAADEPCDFVQFWEDTYTQSKAVDLDLAVRKSAIPSEQVDVFEVEFNSLGGFRVGGWITVPKQGAITRGIVVGHGYGGRVAPDLNLIAPGAAAIFPCSPGFNRSARSDIPGNAAEHVVHGIATREGYLLRFCVAAIWGAVSALLQYAPQTAARIDYMGASFGGGLGAMALPWDKRIHKAFLSVPTFGNHPLRVTLPCVGSGEAVRARLQTSPEIMNVLAFFDSSVAARHIRVPVLFENALFDPAVPPPGQFAVHNAVPGAKELFVRKAGHFEYPGQAEDDLRLRVVLDEWLS
jgi:cephalosporin-C deacetylase